MEKINFIIEWQADCCGIDDYFEIDGFLFMLKDENQIVDDGFIFYNFSENENGSVKYEKTKSKKGKNFRNVKIKVDLNMLDKRINKMIIAAQIYKSIEKDQDFGQIPQAFIAIEDDIGNELSLLDLAEEMSSSSGIVYAELVKKNGWQINIIKKDLKDIKKLCYEYGVDI